MDNKFKKIVKDVFDKYSPLFERLREYEMKEYEDKEEFFKCACQSEGILVTKFGDEPEHYYMSYWNLGSHPRQLGYWQRLKLGLKLIFTGDIFEDEVILKHKEAKRLAKWINEN